MFLVFDSGLFSVKHQLGLGGRGSGESGSVFARRSVKCNFKAKKVPSLDNLIVKKQCRCFNSPSCISGLLVLQTDVFRNMFLKEKIQM